MDAAAYLAQLQSLLPPGDLWRREKNATLTALLSGLAEELARIDARGVDLRREADPRTTSELLEDFERVAGLPDPCVPFVQSVDVRRARLVQKLKSKGGQKRRYYIGLAAGLGIPITITEFRPFRVGLPCTSPLNTPPAWSHAWRVNAPAVPITPFTVASACNEPLRRWGNPLLECVLGRMKPAHTHLLFGYGG